MQQWVKGYEAYGNYNPTHSLSFSLIILPELNIKVDQQYLVLQPNPFPDEILTRSKRQWWRRRLGFGLNREFHLVQGATCLVQMERRKDLND